MPDTSVCTVGDEIERDDASSAPPSTRETPNHHDTAKNPGVALEAFLDQSTFDAEDPLALGAMLGEMVERGFDRLPLPGSGQTLMRWRALAAVAARDLGLVKLFEGHTDALAILAELRGFTSDGASSAEIKAGSRWGVWAAEAPDARLIATRADAGGADCSSGALRLNGTKAWCSGASVLTHALVTAWLDDQPVLAAVELDPSSVSISSRHWHAVGMRATQSGDVHFDGTPAQQVGAPHAYVRRAGFWHGGAGIAACWYGATADIARRLADMSATRADAHRLAHLGEVDIALAGAAEVLRASAAHIDADPGGHQHDVTAGLGEHLNEFPDAVNAAQIIALRARLIVEAAATNVMLHAGRALGAAPLCRDQRFARAMADLPVSLRQSHAERDLAALGEALLARRKVADERGKQRTWSL